MHNIAVVLLNWNGEEDSLACIEALKSQTQQHTIIAIDNGSKDNFVAITEKDYPDITILKNKTNFGFARGVNTGIRHAMDHDFNYVALINNDAVPEDNWLEQLVIAGQTSTNIGITTGMLLKIDGTIDSVGEQYTSWGLPFPSGRSKLTDTKHANKDYVFGGTGGASLYRIDMFKDIGLFDEDFFAYYEDVDISFRAQLAGWKVLYTPNAIAHHKIGASSGKIKGFTTYQTIKNLPWLFWKNVPTKLLPTLLPRFTIAYYSIVFSSLAQGKIKPTLKGLLMENLLLPKKFIERIKIQRSKTVSSDYIKSIITYDLPPNATKLIKVRSILKTLRFWK